VDIEKARDALLKLLMDDPLVLKSPPPTVSIDAAGVTANLLSVEAGSPIVISASNYRP
jgi:small-conductance mechanosensitive channel